GRTARRPQKASCRPWLLPLRPGAHKAHPLPQGLWLPGDRACPIPGGAEYGLRVCRPGLPGADVCAENAIGCFGGGSSGAAPALALPPVRMSIRAAMFAPRETVPVSEAVGRILADVQVGCPPAVPIAVCGEELTPAAVESFRYYGIRSVGVVRE